MSGPRNIPLWSRWSRQALPWALTAGVLAAPAGAQTPQAKPEPTKPELAKPELAKPETDLRSVVDKLQRSEAEQARLKSEIAGLQGDRAKLNAELLKTTDAVRRAETRVSDSQGRLDDVAASEGALRQSLEARRGTITEVLATLQRMGRKPPPAVVVRPEDMLEAIRSAMLLGYVLPEIRGEAESLVADLGELVRLKDAASVERQRLANERDTISGERSRLAALVEARQAQIDSSERALKDERARIEDFSKQAQSLKDLISRAESDQAAMRRATEQASRTPAPAQSPQELAALSSAAFRDPARLQPKIAFTDARGLLALPTNGQIIRPYGGSDGFGGTERGITIAAQAGNIVTSPSDGWVLFAGPYRSYGRVLIINAGNGYNFVLTGLRDTSVEIGQFVLAGEPVGTMGTAQPDARIPEAVAGQPMLYVELRKDNQPIDPSPWWAKNLSEKARG